MRLFLKTFVNKVDGKGRVSVPAQFRAALADQPNHELILFPSFQEGPQFLQGCGGEYMEKLAEATYELDVFSTEQDDMSSLIFASAHPLPIDSTGRVLLPPELMEHAGISDNAAFVGKGKTFQIWNPRTFAEVQKRARERVMKKGMTLSLKKGETGAEKSS